MLKEISQMLFDLFVVNRKAIAVQTSDGSYRTQYVTVTANDILCMLQEKKSLGTYQQLYKTPFLKWICLDFDCNDKSNPDLDCLYVECIKPINDFLSIKNIHFINEFSGRRGIHIWILFDRLIEKNLAYEILEKILNYSSITINTDNYGLDKFPATANSKGNIIGKQVKIPLSTHKRGTQSYFFKEKFLKKDDKSDFYEEQLTLLKNIKSNKIEDVLIALDIKENPQIFFNRLFISEKIDIESSKVIDVLSQTLVYKQLFKRFFSGQAIQKDWFVLLGTFGQINNSSDFLLGILQYSPNYSPEETKEKIKKYGSKYFPATFDYLYKLYNIEMEEFINPKETGLEYLLRILQIPVTLKEWNYNETTFLQTCSYTKEKEIKYLLSNDEVPVVSVFLDLSYFTKNDISQIDNLIKAISNGEIQEYNIKSFYPFKRIESDERVRTMVSLNAYDRVLTTHLALKLAYNLSDKIKSYSYNPNFLSQADIFFHWFTSWGNYLDNIRRYIDLDLYDNVSVITIDIKHFYDSIDFLGITSILNESLNTEEKNIMQFLILYNEQLMRLCSVDESRKGIPQGPAYARIIAEIFLSCLIDKIKEEFKEQNATIDIFRYVDDIIIFNNSEISDKAIYDKFSSIFAMYGLSLNVEKSRIHGKIKDLTTEEKDRITRKNQFQYELKESPYSYLFSEEDIIAAVKNVILQKSYFDINDINYFFSKCMNKQAKKEFFYNCYTDVFNCNYGRGSTFTLFYDFVFDNPDILDFCLTKSAFLTIPLNTINFSCFLASLYYALKECKISKSHQQIISDNFLKKIELTVVDSIEDKTIIESIINTGI